jgi:hypothetical protein
MNLQYYIPLKRPTGRLGLIRIAIFPSVPFGSSFPASSVICICKILTYNELDHSLPTFVRPCMRACLRSCPNQSTSNIITTAGLEKS